jgi:hypothetical protein
MRLCGRSPAGLLQTCAAPILHRCLWRDLVFINQPELLEDSDLAAFKGRDVSHDESGAISRKSPIHT